MNFSRKVLLHSSTALSCSLFKKSFPLSSFFTFGFIIPSNPAFVIMQTNNRGGQVALTSRVIDDSPILVCSMVFGELMLRMVMRKSCFVVVAVVVVVADAEQWSGGCGETNHPTGTA